MFDRKGNVCGIQSATQHYPLGFEPKIKGKTEHQFLNVGRAIHVETVLSFFRDHQVSFESEET